MTGAELLRRRAEQLAAPAVLETAQSLELMVFAVGAAVYAVPLGMVTGVMTEAVTPVPGVQAWVAGFINVRGEIKSVIDLAAVLGSQDSGSQASGSNQRVSTAPHEQGGCVLLLETRFGVVGCLLSAWPQVRRVNGHELQAPLSVQTGLTGVLMGTIALLDIAELLESLQ